MTWKELAEKIELLSETQKNMEVTIKVDYKNWEDKDHILFLEEIIEPYWDIYTKNYPMLTI